MLLDSSIVKRIAAAVGFDGCGIAVACRLGEDEYPLDEWLERGWHGNLGYMERNAEMRRDPRLLVEGARSVISVIRGYNPSQLMKGNAQIARYAYGTDYHETLKEGLYKMLEMLKEQYPGFEAKPCVDTVPISDKHWAAKAGLGWIGRHTLLVTPEWGSWVNIGELVTTAECSHYDTPLSNCCTDCNLCVEACPNDALSHDGSPMLNVTRCTAYQTIENRDESLPDELDRHGYVFGCDLCQAACPYNAPARVKVRQVDPSRIAALEALSGATEDEFKKTTRHSAMSRIKYVQWKRNLPDNN